MRFGEKIYLGLERFVRFFLLLFCLITGFQVLVNMNSYTIGEDDKAVIFFVGIMFVVALACLIRLLYRFVDRLSQKGTLIFAMVSIFGALLIRIWFATKYGIRPITDSFDDIEVAYYLLNHPTVSAENYHAFFMEVFGNNHLFVIFTKYLFRVFQLFSVRDILQACYVFNAFVLALIDLFLWLSVREIRGTKSANKALLLQLLNPLSYLMVYWYYTNTISTLIALILLYLMIKIYRSKSVKCAFPFSVLAGGIVVIGYYMRPTAIFPILAAIVVSFGVLITEKEKRLCILSCIGIGIVIAGITVLVWKQVEERYFHEVMGKEWPITYWLSMGSHGNGDITTKDEDDAIVLDDFITDKNRFLWKHTLDNYDTLGFAGTINLWYRKTRTTWADGYADINLRMTEGQFGGEIYEFVAGSKRQITRAYAQAHRFLLYVGIAGLLIRKRKWNHFESLVLFVLCGGIVFYFIWEAKNQYASPFLPFMCILASQFFEWLSDYSIRLCEVKRRKIIVGYLLVALLVSINLFHLFRQEASLNYRRIGANQTNRTLISATDLYHNYYQTTEVAEEVCQEFYVPEECNKIVFSVQKNAKLNQVSPYEFQLVDANGEVIEERTLVGGNVSKEGYLSVRFDNPFPAGEYIIRLTKTDLTKADIPFLTQETYVLDLYGGSLSINGKKEFPSDLLLEVSYQEEKPRYTINASYIITGVLWLLWCVPLVGVIAGRKDRKADCESN